MLHVASNKKRSKRIIIVATARENNSVYSPTVLLPCVYHCKICTARGGLGSLLLHHGQYNALTRTLHRHSTVLEKEILKSETALRRFVRRA